jgi:hypothetical protein
MHQPALSPIFDSRTRVLSKKKLLQSFESKAMDAQFFINQAPNPQASSLGGAAKYDFAIPFLN